MPTKEQQADQLMLASSRITELTNRVEALEDQKQQFAIMAKNATDELEKRAVHVQEKLNDCAKEARYYQAKRDALIGCLEGIRTARGAWFEVHTTDTDNPVFSYLDKYITEMREDYELCDAHWHGRGPDESGVMTNRQRQLRSDTY